MKLEIITILLVISQLAVLAATLASAEGKPFDWRRRWFRIVNVRGWVVIIGTLLSIYLSLRSSSIQEDRRLAEKAVDQRVFEKKDSIKTALMKREKEKSDSNLMSSFATGLAEYYLKYDTAQKRIEKLVKDSINTTIITAAEPSLDICADGIKLIKQDSLYHFQIGVCPVATTCHDASFKIKVFVLDSLKDRIIGIPGSIESVSKTSIPFPGQLNEYISIGTPNGVKVDVFFFYLEGEYFGRTGKRYPLNSISTFVMRKKMTGLPIPTHRRRILELLKRSS
jgi:hypothetical protein